MFFFKLKREEDWKTPVLVNGYLLGATEYWQIGRDVHDFESSFWPFDVFWNSLIFFLICKNCALFYVISV